MKRLVASSVFPCALSVAMLAGCERPATTPPAASSPSTAAAQPVKSEQHEPEWHYEGAEGPERWGSLSPTFALCSSGRAQSPIDIGGATPGSSSQGLKITLAPATLRIAHNEHTADGLNNGHTIQVNYSQGDTLTLGDASYQLLQYHFHAPSEHTLSGKHLPMEMHMVHKASDGTLAVIGVLIDLGAHNAAFDPVWANLPATKGAETHLEHVQVDVDALLPRTRSTYRYEGSLTTPPCTEGVKWFVMTSPITLSAPQINQFTAIINHNNRPVQPLNGRTVLSDIVQDVP